MSEKGKTQIVTHLGSGDDVGRVTGISEGLKSVNFAQDHEYNPRLQGIDRFPVYQRMVASDGANRAILRAYTLPIIQAGAALEGGRDDIREWVNSWIFNGMKQYLNRACRYLQYGTFAFEQQYGIVNGKTVELSIRPRPPWTWWRPAYGNNGEVLGIHQLFGGQFGWIPSARMVLLVNDAESEGILGDSLFRSAWKHWDYVDGIEKSDAIGINRAGGGIPWAKVKTKDAELFAQIDNTLANMRTHERARLVFYDDVVADFGVYWSNYRNDAAVKSLDYHRRIMYTSAFAQFLALGTGDGSYALSTDQTELFLLALKAVSGYIAEVTNNQRIRRAVDLNWSGLSDDDYPVLTFGSLDAVGIKALGDYLASVKDQLTWTPETEQHLRREGGIPLLTDEQMVDAIESRKRKAEAELTRPAAAQFLSHHPEACDCAAHADKLQLASPPKKTVFTPWRERRGPETFVALLSINAEMDDRQTEVRKDLEAIRAAQVRRHTEALRKLIKDRGRDPALAHGLEALNSKAYTDAMMAHVGPDYDNAAVDVQTELERQAKGQPVVENELEARNQLAAHVLQLALPPAFQLPVYQDERASNIRLIELKAQQLGRDISEIVAAAYRRKAMDLLLDPTMSVDEIIAAAEAEAMNAGNPTIASGASNSATSPMQLGRSAAGKTFATLGEVEFGIYSAYIDSGTCDVCFSADGRQLDPMNQTPKTPNPNCEGTAARCRCVPIWVRKVQ